MAITRRQFLGRVSAATAAVGLAPGFKWLPGTSVSYAAGPSDAIVVFVQCYGGYDGINTVYPVSGNQRTLYDEYRPTLGLPATDAGCAARALEAAFGSPVVLSIGANADGSQYALHPAMEALHGLYAANKLAVLPGVHYPFADHSHFRSEIIWYTLDPLGASNQGWLGRYLNQYPVLYPPTAVPGIMLGGSLNPIFTPAATGLFALRRLSELRFPASGSTAEQQAKKDAFQALYGESDDRDAGSVPELVSIGRTGFATVDKLDEYYKPGSGLANAGQVEALLLDGDGNYDRDNPLVYSSPLNPGDNPNIADMDLARDLKHVAATIRAGASVGARFFHVAIGGFDSHSNQEQGFYHSRLLREVSESVAAFYGEMSQSVALPGGYPGGYETGDLSGRVVLVVFSEFGRTIRQNKPSGPAAGTDHATSIPVFVLGGAVQGGVQYGAHPQFDDPGENDDDLKLTTDFRDVFGTILARWLNVSLGDLGPGAGKLLAATVPSDPLGRSYAAFTPIPFLL